MIRKNKGKLIASSIVILLPMLLGLLLWDKLPERLATHWGPDGTADGWSGRAGAVFLLPLILLAMHWLCILLTARDPKNADQHPKAFRLVIWIVPVLSCLMMGFTYFIALGNAFSALRLMVLVFGLMFSVLGNFMPKFRQNSTLGIKLSWTLRSEENWNATHRFGGKVWAIGGLVMLLCVFLPEDYAMIGMLVVMIPLVVLPVLYSWRFHKKQLAEGTVPEPEARGKADKIGLIVTGLLLAVTVILVVTVCFTGDILIHLEEDALTVEATYWEDLTLPYGAIDSLELREEGVSGSRTNGFGSPRLLMGTFQNEEFGLFTRYTYTDTDCVIVLTAQGRTLVLGLDDPEATRILFDALAEKAA